MKIEIGQATFISDLTEFPLGDFEIILGMDWLNKNKARIDCWQKKVSLSRPKGVRVSYKAFTIKPKTKIIYAMTLKSCFM